MTTLCEDPTWAGEGNCPSCERTFPGLYEAEVTPDGKVGEYKPVTKLDSTGKAAINPEVEYQRMTTCPINTIVTLYSIGGRAVISTWNGRDKHWLGWSGVPVVPQWLKDEMASMGLLGKQEVSIPNVYCVPLSDDYVAQLKADPRIRREQFEGTWEAKRKICIYGHQFVTSGRAGCPECGQTWEYLP